MKNNPWLLMMLFIIGFGFAGCEKKPVEKTMVFEKGSWSDILAKAKKENKPIFLDAFAEWCGPCKWMTAHVFTDSAVAVFYNTRFINAKIDMEKGEGTELAKRYAVQAYPTLLYLNADGEILHRVCGSMPAQEFIQTGETALNPDQRFSKLVNQYRQGNRQPNFLMTYLDALEKGCLSADSVKDEFFAVQKEEDLYSRTSWDVFYRFENDPNSKMFQYVLKNKSKFDERFTKDSVDQKLYEVFLMSSMKQMYQDTSKTAFEKARKTAMNVPFARSAELALEVETIYYFIRQRWNDYAKAVSRLVETYKQNDADAMARSALRIFQNVSDPHYLQKAEQWAKKSVEKNPKPYYLDVYANLLYKNGKKEEAIRQEERAIDLAKAMNMSAEKYEKNLEKFRK